MLASVPLGLAQGEVQPDHANKMAKGLAIFRDGVSQALKQRYIKCHGGEKVRGDLDITTRNLLLKGGSEGPAVVPGSAKADARHSTSCSAMPCSGRRNHDETAGARASTATYGSLSACAAEEGGLRRKKVAG